MRRTSLVYDGLWRCLCPAFDRTALLQAVSSRGHVLRQAQPSTSIRTRVLKTHTTYLRDRGYATDALQANESKAGLRTIQPSQRDHLRRPDTTWEERLLAPTPPSEDALKTASVDEIVTALMALRDPRGWSFHGQDIDRYGRITQFVRHLLDAADQPLSPFVYECMMDAMVDPQGSAQGVRKLLDDASARNIKPTAAMCQSALEALAVHPDYVLRQEVLDIMQASWFTIDTPARQSVVLGLLRDKQYELAYTRLMEMVEQGGRVDLWVYDIFIMVFGRLGFLDEMLTMVYRRKRAKGTDDAMTSLLYYVLDVSSQTHHHTGTMLGWNSIVRNSVLQPSDGILENVLGTAARHGDAELATEAFDLISGRTRVSAYHYEAVAEAFCRSGDMAGTVRTLCIMNRNGVRAVKNNTRVMYESLVRKPDIIDDAEMAIRAMRRDEVIPQVIVSVVIEAKSQVQGSETAMDLYNDVQELSGEPPKSGLLQALIINSKEDETVRTLVKAYKEFVPEDADTVRNPEVYKHLIPACAKIGELDLAFRFARQATAGTGGRPGDIEAGIKKISKWQLSWLKPLATAAFASEDKRIWPIVDGLSRRADAEAAEMVQRMLRQMRIVRQTKGVFGGVEDAT